MPDYGLECEDVSRQQLLDILPESPVAGHGGGHDAQSRTATSLDALIKILSAATEVYGLPSAVHRMAVDAELRHVLLSRVAGVTGWLDKLEGDLDEAGGAWGVDLLEDVQRMLRQARDLLWSIENDRIQAAERAARLAGGDAIGTVRTALAYLTLDTVLEALDRLEVRGRDSAGVQVWVTLDDDDAARLPVALRDRRDEDYGHQAVSLFRGGVVLVYKRASIIGRLGDNVAYLRAAIAEDEDLSRILAMPSARASVLAHTRWASVGRISVPNAHPVDSAPTAASYATAVLNGDIDNHTQLREQLRLPADETGISTDAKLIPVMMSGAVESGSDPVQALAGCLRSYDGSFAIAAQSEAEPDRLYLAVRGSGQGLYVGFARGCFLVASEVYGLVAQTGHYLRLDGTTTVDGYPGVVVRLDRDGAGTLSALHRYDALGQAVPVGDGEVSTAGITTRDIARGPFEHYLSKEISEAPSSFRKSLRGRIADDGERMTTVLGESALPQRLRDRFANGEIREVIFVGQGTAAVACQGIANVVRQLLHPTVSVEAMPATEMSAWGLRSDMSSVCVVAVSQSGSTTDTNRAVDMVRSRGAAVLCIVNRRDSDLAHKSDGVLYTSDGRDVEMAVASTKAFYSQVATGAVLGLQMAKVCDRLPAHLEDTLLRALLEIPHQLEELQELAPQLAEVAQVAMGHSHWAVVGSGPNRVAAEEARIKLSELCYKSISTDAVEDKKHVDLSAEAFILICAAGTPASQVRDLAKEVDIFAAHRNSPVVIVDEGVDLDWATEHVIRVPVVHPIFAWVLSTATSHLLAYETARAINEKAQPLREALVALEASVDAGRVALADLDQACDNLHQFLAECANGSVRGVLGSDTAVRLAQTALFLRHGGTTLPTKVSDPADFVRDQITAAVDELTRSIDSVMHQAKTVTVGTSRGDSDLLENVLTSAMVGVGATPDALGYSTLVALRAFARVVAEVDGATRYQIIWSPERATIRAIRKAGSAEALPSRADGTTELLGSKRLSVQSRTVRLVRGARDGRLVLLIPEQTGARVHALTLLHVSLRDAVEPAQLTEIMDLTGTRLEEIRAAVTEKDVQFTVDALAELPVETVLLGSVGEVTGALTASA